MIDRIKRGLTSRTKLLRQLPQQSVGVEVGVFKGEFSGKILKVVNPRELHLIDVWWTLFGENYPDWGSYTAFGKLTTKEAYNTTLKNIKKFQDNCKIHIGFSVAILEGFDDDYFDWAYIDSSHQYHQTIEELEILDKKVKSNGIICGHDWQPNPKHRHHGVYKAVNEFVENNSWKLMYTDFHTQWALKQK